MKPAEAHAIPLSDVALVAVGGAVGSGARYVAVDDVVPSVGLLPTVALMLVAGCLVLGIVVKATSLAHPLRTFAIGACGGFASFSMYAVAGAALSTAWVGVVFLVVTPMLALGAMAAGYAVTGLVVRR